MDFKIISIEELADVIDKIPHGFSRGVLFSGDRYLCIDEGIALSEGEELIALATIAPDGEMMSGIPTIVGIWVNPGYRCLGYGLAITQKVIERCIERGFETVRLDALVEPIVKIYNKLPSHLKQHTKLENFIIPGFPVFLD